METKQVGTFASAMTIVGAIIGAGFASGQEIYTFFGFAGWSSVLFVVPLFLMLFFGISLAFNSGAKNTFDLGKICFGKFAVVLEWIFAFCCFCLLSSMIAGMRALCYNMPAIFLVAFLVVGLLLYFGINGIVRANAVVLPILIMFLVAMCIFCFCNEKHFASVLDFSNSKKLLANCVLYTSMNAFCALPVVLPLGQKCKRKKLVTAIACCVICALFLFELIALLVCKNANAELPILQICLQMSAIWGAICTIVLLIATSTTLLSCGLEVVGFAQKFIKNRAICVVFMLFSASLFSILGFEKIVRLIYPFLGGIGFVVFCVLFFAQMKHKKYFVPNS